ncbi:MAG: hypothetical protein RR790_07615, partial [Eubacterium sp.]
TIESRVIGFMMGDGVNTQAVKSLKSKLESEGAIVQIIASSVAPVKADDGSKFEPKHSISSVASVSFDALYICSGEKSAKELMHPERKPIVTEFINEAYKHCKAIYFGKDTDEIYKATVVSAKKHEDPAIISTSGNDSDEKFISAIAKHRVWDLEKERNSMA